MSTTLIYESLVLENRVDFVEKVKALADRLGIKPNWLMVVFYIETAAVRYGRINSKIQNSIGATGLIQFMPATAKALGTSTQALALMRNLEQLDYVEKYLQVYKGKMKSLTDTYLAVFFPAAMGKPANTVLQTKHLPAEKIARFNPAYDLNKDKKITVGEITTQLLKFVKPGYDI